jgi:hypothetical protein
MIILVRKGYASTDEFLCCTVHTTLHNVQLYIAGHQLVISHGPWCPPQSSSVDYELRYSKFLWIGQHLNRENRTSTAGRRKTDSSYLVLYLKMALTFRSGSLALLVLASVALVVSASDPDPVADFVVTGTNGNPGKVATLYQYWLFLFPEM